MASEVYSTSAKVITVQEPIKGPPAPHTVRIYSKADASFLDVFPIDAKESVAMGGYSYDPPTLPVAQAEVENAPSAEQADLEAMTKAELQVYAEQHDIAISPAMTKAEQIETIRAGAK